MNRLMRITRYKKDGTASGRFHAGENHLRRGRCQRSLALHLFPDKAHMAEQTEGIGIYGKVSRCHVNNTTPSRYKVGVRTAECSEWIVQGAEMT